MDNTNNTIHNTWYRDMSTKFKHYLILILNIMMTALYSWLLLESAELLYLFPLILFGISTVLWIIIIRLSNKNDNNIRKYTEDNN